MPLHTFHGPTARAFATRSSSKVRTDNKTNQENTIPSRAAHMTAWRQPHPHQACAQANLPRCLHVPLCGMNNLRQPHVRLDALTPWHTDVKPIRRPPRLCSDILGKVQSLWQPYHLPFLPAYLGPGLLSDLPGTPANPRLAYQTGDYFSLSGWRISLPHGTRCTFVRRRFWRSALAVAWYYCHRDIESK